MVRNVSISQTPIAQSPRIEEVSGSLPQHGLRLGLSLSPIFSQYGKLLLQTIWALKHAGLA